MLGQHGSLLSQRMAGSSISEEDLDIISMSQKLSAGNMPVVNFLMMAHGAFTPNGLISLRKTLALMKLVPS